MKALSVDQNGKLDVCDVPKPVYGDCQALVKTLSCGVCNGTDMKLIVSIRAKCVKFLSKISTFSTLKTLKTT